MMSEKIVNKKKILLRGPVMSRSGYGEQARFALRSLRSQPDLFDIYILNTAWGHTGQTIGSSEEDQFVKNTLLKTTVYTQQQGQFDISLQVTVPNEFQKIAPINIGYTAGIETTKVAPEWIAASNQNIDRIITTSTHATQILRQTRYDAKDQNGVEHKNWGLEAPVTAVNYPIRKYESEELDIDFVTNKNFLVVSQWGIRKNLDNTIKWFVEAFKDDSDVGLIVKTNLITDSIADREATTNKLRALLAPYEDRKCKIYLLHGEISTGALAWLYEHPTMKATINIGHGEGFGLPLFESVCHGLPVITTSWSGQNDFIHTLTKKGKKIPRFIKVEYDIKDIQKEAIWPGILVEDSKWCYVRENSYKKALKDCLEKETHYRKNANILQKYVLENFTPEKKYAEFVDAMGIEAQTTEGWLTEIEDMLQEYE